MCFECDSLSEEVGERKERSRKLIQSGCGKISLAAASLILARINNRGPYWPDAVVAT